MIALCDCVNDQGNGFPGYKTLMKKTSMAKSTLSIHLNVLRIAGIITTESHAEIGKGRKVNTYHVSEFWKNENLKTSIIEARKERKVRGLNLSEKQPEKYEGRTGTKSMTLEPRKVRGSNPKSTRVEHEPSVLTISNEPSVVVKHRKIELKDLGNVSEDVAKEFIDHRVNIKKPLTQKAFTRAINQAHETSTELGDMSADEVIEKSIDAGWQGIGEPQWFANRKTTNNTKRETHHERSERQFKEHLQERERYLANNGGEIPFLLGRQDGVKLV